MKREDIATLVLISLASAASCSNPPDAGTGTTSTTAGPGSTTGSPTSTTGSRTSTTSDTTTATSTMGAGGMGTGGNGAGGSTGGAGGLGGTGGAGTGGAGTGGTGTCLPGVLGHPDCTQPTPPAHAGFTLYLVEDFSAPIDLVNDPIWTYSDGEQPEGDQRFVKDAITFAGGNMVITATARNIPGSVSCSEKLPNVP